MTTPRKSPLETSSESSENHASKTNPEFWPAVVAFLIIPIYTLLITVIAIKIVYYSGGYKFLRNGLAIKLIFVLLICVAGFSVRSLECARTIFTNPFRAFSVGRYVFGLFILVNLTCNIIFEWPQDLLYAPPEAIVDQSDQEVLLDKTKVEYQPIGLLDYSSSFLSVLFSTAEDLTIFLFLVAGYKKTRGDRPEYIWDHFLHDISFGKYGTQYTTVPKDDVTASTDDNS